jgi:hypothetical protein
MAKPRHEPTPKTMAEAKAYAAVGVPHHDIALLIGVSIKTLLKYYRTEMDIGKARANATVAKGLFSSATKGNLGAQIFWMKSQAGWREVQSIEHTGKDGGPIETKNVSDLTDDELLRIASSRGARAAAKKAGKG